MNDDWRLRIDIHEAGRAHLLTRHLGTSELEHELETTFHDRVIVSTEGSELFCYTGTREQAEAAERAIRAFASKQNWEITAELTHWHAESETWVSADAPEASGEAERAAEHAELMQHEREESRAQGFPDYEVRVECRSSDECAEFAERLQSEGLTVVRRSRYLVIGADDEDSAHTLADRVRREAPAGSSVVAEGNLQAAMANTPTNPFAIFGGLGG